MAEPAAKRATVRFLTFRQGSTLFALPAEEISEIIRIPPLARVPQSPPSLLGLANLRGAVLPVASVGRLLQRKDSGAAPSRAVVLDGAAPVALAVDAVEALVAVDPSAVETRQAELAAEPGERLRGAFRVGPGDAIAKIIDIAPLLDAAFTARTKARRSQGVGRAEEGSDSSETGEKIVTFEVAGQEFGLPLADVREIVSAPDKIAIVPRAEAVVLGMMAYRDTLLPLLSFRGLLGFPPLEPVDGREKVVVTVVGGLLVGLVADRMRAIVSADPALVEPTPAMLAARVGGESRIRSIYRGNGGRRLVSILSPDQLFREDVMQRLGVRSDAGEAVPIKDEDHAGDLQILVFRLGDDEFGLPIEVVDEVAKVPTQISRLPKTPKFLEGVINLRGEVLPVVDQRRRFDMPPSVEPEGRRLVVVRTERHRAGLIVDSVSEVLRTHDHRIEPAPDLAGEATRLVQGVVNLEAAARMILLLDPAELLTRAERALLDKLEGAPGPK